MGNIKDKINMQVNNINNTSFGAKFKIEGYTADISKKFIKSWEKKAKLIGTDADTLTLKMGKPETEQDSWGSIMSPKKATIKSRRVRMESNINDKDDEKILGYYTSEKIDIHQRMLDRITSYLDKLVKKHS